MEQGPLTSSDNLPIILKLSTFPMQIKSTPGYKMSAANWEGYRVYLENYEVLDLQNKTLEDTDDEIIKFHEKIQEAADLYIPKTSYRTQPHIKMTKNMRRLQMRFN